MLLEGKMWTRFMINVAMACTVRESPKLPLNSCEAAAFVRDVLHIALNGQPPVAVEVLPYPVTTKVPLLLSVGSSGPRLFWYYPTQGQDVLSEQLAELVSELQAEYPALATA